MKRRGFFATVLGALCAPFLPKSTVPDLMWRKDAFAVVFDWPAIEAMQSVESTARPDQLFVTSGGRGYVVTISDVERARQHE